MCADFLPWLHPPTAPTPPASPPGEAPFWETGLHRTMAEWEAVRGFFRYQSLPADLDQVDSFTTQAILFDTYSTVEYGGTGKTFDWKILKKLNTDKNIILSGR